MKAFIETLLAAAFLALVAPTFIFGAVFMRGYPPGSNQLAAFVMLGLGAWLAAGVYGAHPAWRWLLLAAILLTQVPSIALIVYAARHFRVM